MKKLLIGLLLSAGFDAIAVLSLNGKIMKRQFLWRWGVLFFSLTWCFVGNGAASPNIIDHPVGQGRESLLCCPVVSNSWGILCKDYSLGSNSVLNIDGHKVVFEGCLRVGNRDNRTIALRAGFSLDMKFKMQEASSNAFHQMAVLNGAFAFNPRDPEETSAFCANFLHIQAPSMVIQKENLGGDGILVVKPVGYSFDQGSFSIWLAAAVIPVSAIEVQQQMKVEIQSVENNPDGYGNVLVKADPLVRLDINQAKVSFTQFHVMIPVDVRYVRH